MVKKSDDKIDFRFPIGFLWGAATAAHQVEGDNYNQWTVNELEYAKHRSDTATERYHGLETWQNIKSEAVQPDNYISGKLADHYHNYRTDFKLLEQMNMNAYRFSLEWSRLEPKEGEWDTAAFQHYKDYIAYLDEHNIEPIMTLFHFSLPNWFVEKGGFEKRSNIKYYLRFVSKVLDEIKLSVKYIITINEPVVYAYNSYKQAIWPPMMSDSILTYRVIKNLIWAHKKAAKMIHNRSIYYKVSIAKNVAYFYPGDDAWLTQLSVKLMQYFQSDFVLNRVIRECDFIGLNFYNSHRVIGYRIHGEKTVVNDLGWTLRPSDIESVLIRLYDKYHKPIMITENGLADGDDKKRKWWILNTIVALKKAMNQKVRLIGYLHWSLMDNFEWAEGKWPRFGLIGIEYNTKRRYLRPSAVWFGKVINKIRNG